jgi:hypothetical protein
VAALAFVSGTWSGPAAQASSSTGNNGEFIIRCPMTGEVQPIDPIMVPGGTAPHTHMFFGHYNVKATSTAAGLRKQGSGSKVTTCQDPDDTAAYWAPESFLNGQPYLPGCSPPTTTGGNWSCGTDTNSTIYVRAYYLTTSGASTQELPPGLIMVVGTPDATSPPKTIGNVYWDCGATPKVQTPDSIWPYTCSQFSFAGEEGVTEIIDFPSCWDGKSSFTSPNGSAKVPGYFDPSLDMPTPNDLAYPPKADDCAALDTATLTYHAVPHVSVRIHYVNLGLSVSLSTDGSIIDPSSCKGSTFSTCKTQESPPNDLALQLSSTQTQGGPGPWYTEHADYWQTWQQGASPLGNPKNSGEGVLNNLTYYCLDKAVTCSFEPANPAKPTFPPNPPYPSSATPFRLADPYGLTGKVG